MIRKNSEMDYIKERLFEGKSTRSEQGTVMAPANALLFKPIDLNLHADTCLRFTEDMFQMTQGSTLAFHGADGKGAERYLQWLAQGAHTLPGSMLHVWQGERIVGQLEMSRPQTQVGYLHLFYLAQAYRHLGLGQLLHQHVLAFFQDLRCTQLRLSVWTNNRPALRFYQRNGWQDIGPREGAPGFNRFTRTL